MRVVIAEDLFPLRDGLTRMLQAHGLEIVAAVDLLQRKPKPNDDDIATISNLCRCGTYPRIRKAILHAAESIQAQKK